MQILSYLIRTIILITIGVVFANIVIETNILSKLTSFIKPLCKFSNLPQESVFSIFTTLVDPIAGKSTLAEFYKKNKVTKTETLLTLLISTFPVVLGESLFRVQAPIAIVMLGPTVGVIYVVLNLFSSFIQTFGALIYSKLRLPKRTLKIKNSKDFNSVAHTFVLNKEVVYKGVNKSLKTLKKIIPIMVIAILLIRVFMDMGGEVYIAKLFNPILNLLKLPESSIPALLAQFMHFSAGYAVVGDLLANGKLTAKQAIITLLIGSMAVITMIYARSTFPLYFSLFGKFGFKLTIIAYFISMMARIITLLLVLIFL
ncbi:MAG: nucleoside recognition domain-containing protein [Methanosarcinales archaeon]